MPTISTEDCKALLVQHFAGKGRQTIGSHWRQLRKYKNEKGLVSRDFEHPVLGRFVLVESDGVLSIAGASGPGVDNSTAVSWLQKTFSPEDVIGARALVEKLLASGWDDDRGAIKESPEFEQYAHALPAAFSFHFPADTYGNGENVVVNLDTRLGELCIMLEDLCDGSSDEYSHSLVVEQLPLCVERSPMDEYHYGFVDEHKGLTVGEFIETMLAAGFSYTAAHCTFGRVAKPVELAPAQAASAEPAVFSLKHVRTAINQDDAVQLESFLKAGLHPDALFANKASLLVTCFEQRAKRCYRTLIEYDASLIGTDRHGGHILAVFAGQSVSWEEYVQPSIEYPGLDFTSLNRASYGGPTTLLEGLVRAVFCEVIEHPETAVRAGLLLGVLKSRCVGCQFGEAALASLYAAPGVLWSGTLRALIFAEIEADRSLLDKVPAGGERRYGFIAALVEQGDYPAALTLMRQYTVSPEMIYLSGVPLLTHLRNSMARLEAELRREDERGFRMIAVNSAGEEINEQRAELHRIRDFLENVAAQPGYDAPSM